ncbi:EGFR-like transmembrane domain-containing protein [Paractinoplanes lichenicola]|uniref:LPXTG cell wall anchor domain-containing protein n=1 Tax=Paractinoplanes lichenicola TaxID=2802976 RepID=A0ABS1VVM5_9ACTN|nr:transmembrane domain-containing protein [Actinoplanes lichenicola]MBL7258507.1 LPXTG cell wall anchor domain-containing protein [Actinoplanes lichenicola]
MTTVRRLLGLASAAALTAMLIPAPAQAAVPSTDPNAVLVAGPAPKTFTGVPDKWVNETLEVRNDSDKPLRVVLHVKTKGLWFASSYITCKYSDSLPPTKVPDVTDVEEAICQPPNEIEPGGSYKFGGGFIRTHPKAQPGAEYSYEFTWYTKEYADAQGPTWLGRDKLTHTGFHTLALMTKVTPETPYTGDNSSSGKVVIPAGETPPTTPPATATPEPTVTPTATVGPTLPPGDGEEEPSTPAPTSSSPAAPTTSPVAGGVGGGDDTGGGLPLTGTNVAVVGGLGAVLLIGGAGAFLLARRRRTSFSA